MREAPGLVPGINSSPGEWKMQVHQEGSVTEFTISSIDSLAFYDDTWTVHLLELVCLLYYLFGTSPVTSLLLLCYFSATSLSLPWYFFITPPKASNEIYRINIDGSGIPDFEPHPGNNIFIYQNLWLRSVNG